MCEINIGFFFTNIDKGKIYCEYKGSISDFLSSLLHESVILEFVIILITLFLNSKIFSLYGWFPQKIISQLTIECKVKSVPLQAWSGPEGSRKLRFPDFMTMSQGDGKVSHMHRPHLPPGNSPGTHFC